MVLIEILTHTFTILLLMLLACGSLLVAWVLVLLLLPGRHGCRQLETANPW